MRFSAGFCAALVGTSLMFAACAAQSSKPSQPAMDNPEYDRKVTAHVGETFTLTLQENATTGYRWAIDHVDADALESLGPQANYPSEQRVGAHGEVAFSFRAKRAGSTDIALKHWRHWEGDKSITQHYRVHVDVGP